MYSNIKGDQSRRIFRGKESPRLKVVIRKRHDDPWEASNLLMTLSRPGVLKLLTLVANGLRKEEIPCKKLGITQKQLGTNLSKLVTDGLLEKNGNKYVQTKFGSLVSREYIPRLEAAVCLQTIRHK